MRVPPTFLFLAGAAALVAACASRPLNPSFPATSAASLDGDAVPAASVTTALEADPPLPGETTDGWSGLESAPGQPSRAHQPHGHGGHGH